MIAALLLAITEAYLIALVLVGIAAAVRQIRKPA